jgi:signal transduction histidine kinase
MKNPFRRSMEEKAQKNIGDRKEVMTPTVPVSGPAFPVILLLLLLLLLLLAAGTLAAGFLYSRGYEKQIRSLAEQRLSFVAESKADEIVRWRNERLADAGRFFNNELFSELVSRYFKDAGDLDAKRKLDAWFVRLRISSQYSAIHLLDSEGRVRLFDPPSESVVSEVLLKRIPEVLRSRKIEFQDFYRDEHNGRISLGLLIPIVDEKDPRRALAVLSLEIMPETFLDPLIQHWPMLNKTAETLLVRKEGKDVLFLNQLKFQKDAALKLRFPLSDTYVPAVKAVLGTTGIVEGLDYRGVKVVASLRAIPDSPWFLVSRMDASEIYESLRSGMRSITGLFILSALVMLVLAALFWREQKVRSLKRREEDLRKMNQELEKRVGQRTGELSTAVKEMEAFSYSVSHDLKAPLRAMSGFANILAEDYAPKLDANGRRLVGVINENAKMMGQLIDDLLKLAHLARLAINFADIDVATLVQSIDRELREELFRGRSIEVSLKPLPVARADSTLAKQIFTNLISNAMKFTAGKEKAVIEIGGYDKDGERVYYVKDNGAGFDMKYEDKLFGIFQRLHTQDEFGGTGIGLAIVKSAVRRHGGRVWAEGEVDKGATFYFTLSGRGMYNKTK